MADYTVHVCPLCGAQVNIDGGWDGRELEFTCDHQPWDAEYGNLEPLELPVQTPANLQAALQAHKPILEAQKLNNRRLAEEAQARREARLAAMTPEERDREDRTNRLRAAGLKNIVQQHSRMLDKASAFYHGWENPNAR